MSSQPSGIRKVLLLLLLLLSMPTRAKDIYFTLQYPTVLLLLILVVVSIWCLYRDVRYGYTKWRYPVGLVMLGTLTHTLQYSQ